MTRKYWLNAFVGLFALTACGDDTTSPGDTDTDGTSTSSATPMTETTPSTTVEPTMSTTMMATDTEDPSSSSTDPTDPSSSSSETTDDPTTGPPADPVDFMVTITNISDQSPLPTPFSPGVWVTHEIGSQPVFQFNMAHLGNGLVELAEDGDPAMLDAAMDDVVEVEAHGIFDTPVKGKGPVILPGESYEFMLTEPSLESRLSVFTMLVQSNDIFLGTGPNGVGLYLPSGDPQAEDNIADVMEYWDVGSEANQAPAGGLYQAPRQGPPNTGPDETGMISRKSESTHAVPFAPGLADVDVTYDMVSGDFTIEISNISDEKGGFISPMTPAVWALHDDTVTVFQNGDDAGDIGGLENLAEDGETTGLLATLASIGGVAERGNTLGGAAPGASMTFTVTPSGDDRFIWFASMLEWTNDGFLSTQGGIALLDDMGMARSTAAIEREFDAMLQVFDAGTEENEASGVAGPNNALNQAAIGVGNSEDNPISFFLDPTNDFEDLSNIIEVEVVQGVGVDEFDVTIRNSSLGGPFLGTLTPVVWAVHDGTFSAFEDGEAASPGLEELAEDGMTDGLDSEIDMTVTNHGVETGNISAGNEITFTITTDSDEPVFSFWTMVVPSNDTFASLGGSGIPLYNGGTALSNEDLATEVANALDVWDAGTEGNQAGAGGADMAGVPGSVVGAGPGNGNGQVRQVEDDEVWAYPAPNQMIEIIVSPIVR